MDYILYFVPGVHGDQPCSSCPWQPPQAGTGSQEIKDRAKSTPQEASVSLAAVREHQPLEVRTESTSAGTLPAVPFVFDPQPYEESEDELEGVDNMEESSSLPILIDSQQKEVELSPVKYPVQPPKNYQVHGETVWTNPKMNSAERARPWAVIAEKESTETVKKVMAEIMDPQTVKAMSKPILCVASETQVAAITSEIKLKMADGKLWTTLTGRGGAECHMGKCSRQDIHSIDRVREGFFLDHDLNDIKEVISKYSDEDGDIVVDRDDFHIRFGQTGVNLTDQDVTDSLSVLHLKIAWFGMANELIIRHGSKVLKHNSGPLGSLKDHLERFRDEWMSSLGLVIGFKWEKKPNLTGHHFERMFSPKNREAIIDLLSRQPVWKRRWRRDMLDSEKAFFR